MDVVVALLKVVDDLVLRIDEDDPPLDELMPMAISTAMTTKAASPSRLILATGSRRWNRGVKGGGAAALAGTVVAEA